MRTFYNKLISTLLILIVLVMMFCFLIQPKRDFSDNENRNLQKFPSFSLKHLTNGQYISELENYINDQFPLRDYFMELRTKIDILLGKQDIDNIYLGKDDYLLKKFNEPKNSDKIIKVLNDFNEKVNYVNMNLLLVPTSISINDDLLPKNAPTYDEIDSINYFYNKINFDTIKTYDILKEQNKNYQMYYKLDHHWTSFGAYYAYTKYASANNINAYTLNSFDIEEVTNDFKGSFYSTTLDNSRNSDSIHIFKRNNTSYSVKYMDTNKGSDSLYNMDYLDKKDKYSLFLDNNHSLIVITNNNLNNDKELIVIKDSFANSIIPFLINHYEKIHIIDPRYYRKSISEYIKENKSIKDGLILYNINSIDTDKGILSLR